MTESQVKVPAKSGALRSPVPTIQNRLRRLSISAQVIVLVVTVVLLFQLFSLAINFVYLRGSLEREARDSAPTFFRFALPAVLDAPPEVRDAIAGSFRTPIRAMTITSTPSAVSGPDDVLQPQQAAGLAAFLRDAGIPVAEARAVRRKVKAPARAAGLSKWPKRGVMGMGREGFVSALAMGRSKLPNWAAPGGGEPLPPGTATEMRTVHIVSIRLEGAPTWYNLANLQQSRTPLAPLLLPALALVPAAALLVGVSLLVLRRITRPLRSIRAKADALGRGEFGGDIPEEGGSDVLPTIRAFNTMSQRINQAIDYQVSLVRSLGSGPIKRFLLTRF